MQLHRPQPRDPQCRSLQFYKVVLKLGELFAFSHLSLSTELIRAHRIRGALFALLSKGKSRPTSFPFERAHRIRGFSCMDGRGELCNRLICAAEYGAGRAMPTGNRGYAAHCQKLASRRRRLSKINSWSDVSATCCDRLPDVPAKDRVEAGSNPNLFRGCTTKTLVDEFSAVSMPNSPVLQNRER